MCNGIAWMECYESAFDPQTEMAADTITCLIDGGNHWGSTAIAAESCEFTHSVLWGTDHISLIKAAKKNFLKKYLGWVHPDPNCPHEYGNAVRGNRNAMNRLSSTYIHSCKSMGLQVHTLMEQSISISSPWYPRLLINDACLSWESA